MTSSRLKEVRKGGYCFVHETEPAPLILDGCSLNELRRRACGIVKESLTREHPKYRWRPVKARLCHADYADRHARMRVTCIGVRRDDV